MLDPKITKESNGNLTLRWTSDPKAQGYVIDTPTKQGVIAGKAKTSSNLGVHDEITVSIAPLYAQVKEAASYPAPTPPPPSEWKTVAASEGASFTLTEAQEVRYGKDPTWTSKVLTAGTHKCDNATFGDPLVGIAKHCEARDISFPPDPDPDPGPPPVTGEQTYPFWGHKWGGNESAAAKVVTLLYSKAGQCDPNAARAAGNKGLIALLGGALDPFNGDWKQRHMFDVTYGGGLMTWPGGGGVRAYLSSDDSGMKLQDPSEQGTQFAVQKAPTDDWLASAYIRSWTLEGKVKGFNGFHSDNLFPGSRLTQYFRAPLTTDPATWDTGLVRLINTVLAVQGLGGNKGFGGNTVYLTDNPAVRKVTQFTEVEDLETWIGSPSLFASRSALLQAWQADGPQPKYTLVGHSVQQSDTAGLRLGLACACILGGAYGPGNSDDDLYFPSGFTQGEFGKVLGPFTKSGNTYSRKFEHKTITVNLDTKQATFV